LKTIYIINNMKPYNCPHCQEDLVGAAGWILVCPNCGWKGTITYLTNLMNEKNRNQFSKSETSGVEQPR